MATANPGWRGRGSFRRGAARQRATGVGTVRQDQPADPPLKFASPSCSRTVRCAFVSFGVSPLAPLVPAPAGSGAQGTAAWLAAKTRIDPRKIRYRKPVFPSGVTLNRGEGALVIIEIELDVEGRIVAQRLVRGSQPFVDAAMEAVRDRRFSPALADGKPVPFTMNVTVNFQGG